MDEPRITIAVLGKPRGVRGEIKAYGHSSKPERFETLKRVFLTGHPNSFPVEEVWEHKGILIFKLGGIDSIEAAEPLQGCEVQVPASERVELDPGEYFDSDLAGCQVVDRATGQTIGTVKALQEGAGGGLLVLDGDTLIPFAKGICVGIDVALKRIEVVLPAGLLELNADVKPGDEE